MKNLGEFKCKLQMEFYRKITYPLIIVFVIVSGVFFIQIPIIEVGLYFKVYYVALGILFIIYGLKWIYLYILDIKTVERYEIYEKGYKDITTDEEFLFKDIDEYHYVQRDDNTRYRSKDKYLIVKNKGKTSIFSTKMGRHSTTGRYSIDKFLEIYNDEILKYKIQNIRNGNSERFEVRQKSLIGRNIHESSKDFLDKIKKFDPKVIIELCQDGIKIDNKLYLWSRVAYKNKQTFFKINLEIYDKENDDKILDEPLFFIENNKLLLTLMESFGIKSIK